MRSAAILAFSLACGVSLQAQEMPQAEANVEKELPIPSTVFIPPPPPKEVPAMKVEAATTRKLPTHQITVIRSEASTLPDIPPPPEPKPFVQGPIGEPHYLLSFGKSKEGLVMLYGQSRVLLTSWILLFLKVSHSKIRF